MGYRSVLTTLRSMGGDQQYAKTVHIPKDSSQVFDDVLDGEMLKQSVAGAPETPYPVQGRIGRLPRHQPRSTPRSPKHRHVRVSGHTQQDQPEEVYRPRPNHPRLRPQLESQCG